MRYIELNNEVMKKKDGFFQLWKDQEAIKEFEKEVMSKYMKFDSHVDRVRWLVDNNYYYNVFEQYTPEQIQKIHEYLYSYGFTFKSFMAIFKFYNSYALKTNDKKYYLETYEDHIAIVALYLAQGDFKKAMRYAEVMIKQLYQPATPTFLNAGRARRGELVSCFLLEVDDTLNSIFFVINTAAQLSKIGGGVAINLSKLRGHGDPIKEVEGAASGVLPVLKLLEDTFSYVDQLGQRQGAGAAYLNVFHWDIVDFLNTKKINADEKVRLATLSIGLIIPSKFFELAKANRPLVVFSPYSVYKEYGIHLDDMNMDEMYEKLLNNPRVRKREVGSARDFLTEISKSLLESGYPYLMFKDNANKVHPLKDIGQIKMSNLCTEIYQLSETSEITDYGEPDKIGRDINCNLGSLNIVNVMEQKTIQEAVHAGMEMLTAVSDMSDIKNAPTVKKANEELHSVGLGAMNLHGYLAKNRIMYESEEAREFADIFFMMVNFYSIEKSMMIARERGVAFKDFEKSEYAKGTYFDKYLQKDYFPKSEKVKALFEGTYIPTREDWEKLKEDVQKYGLYNAYRLAIAPTQSISYVQNSTSSVMPIVSQVETRSYGDSITYYPMPYLSPQSFWYYKSAYDMDQMKVIDMVATIQEHVDQGISCVLHVNQDISTRELGRLIAYAHHKGLKSLYYTRTRRTNIEECLSCSV